jgi:hypothetical protein
MLNLHQPHGSFDIADLMLNLHWNRAPHAATEMNFGLHSASGKRLARHGG